MSNKASREEQCSVIHFLWAKGVCPNTIHSEIRPVDGDKCFTRQYMFGVRSLFVGEKVLLMEIDLVDVLFERQLQRSQQLCLSYTI